MEMVAPTVMEKAEINGQHVWHHLLVTTIGELHIVQHEKRLELNIVDDYMGWSNRKAEEAFRKILTKIVNWKD
jgi:hypothetical protein